MSAFFLEQKRSLCYYIINVDYDREVCFFGRAFADDETVF